MSSNNNTIIEQKWNPSIIILSYLVSVFGSYTTLQIISQIMQGKYKKRVHKQVWLLLASISFGGCAVWSMHFVGMLALDIGMEISYDRFLTVLSLLAAIASSRLGFQFLMVVRPDHLKTQTRKRANSLPHYTSIRDQQHDSALEDDDDGGGIESKLCPSSPASEDMEIEMHDMAAVDLRTPRRPLAQDEDSSDTSSAVSLGQPRSSESLYYKDLSSIPVRSLLIIILGSFFVSIGIFSMHYIGMAAMHMNSIRTSYNPFIIVLSFAIAWIASTVSLITMVRFSNVFHQCFAALIMALAVCSMHYTGMFAATYVKTTEHHNVTGIDPCLLAMSTSLITMFICFIFIGITATTNSITEKALIQSERNFRTLAAVSPAGMFYADAEGRWLYLNDRARKIMGLDSVDKAKGDAWLNTVHPEDSQRVSREWFAALREKRPFNSEFRFLHSLTGRTVWVLAQAMPECDDKHHSAPIKSYIGTITDISERKELERLAKIEQAEEAQRQRAQQAEEYRAKQDEFIDTICHELRNPLNGICGTLELLKDNMYTMNNDIKQLAKSADQQSREVAHKLRSELDELAKNIESIHECAVHQTVIVNDVLTVSKLDAAKVDLEMTLCDPKAVVVSVARMFEPKIIDKGNKLVLNLPQDNSVIRTDVTRLKQILINLISNSVKFTEGGTITISMSLIPKPPSFDSPYSAHNQIHHRNSVMITRNCYLRFTVEDTGIGMTKEELSHIFERFSQANRRIANKYGGSGLGLTICSKLVKLLGGTISVQSEKNKGTKFTVQIECEHTPSLSPMTTSPHFLVLGDDSAVTSTSSQEGIGPTPAAQVTRSSPPRELLPATTAAATPTSIPTNSTTTYGVQHQAECTDLQVNKDRKVVTVLVTEDNEINLKVLLNYLDKYNKSQIDLSTPQQGQQTPPPPPQQQQQQHQKQQQRLFFRYLVGRNGQEAVDIYRQMNVEQNLPPGQRLDLILMDIEMPVMNGYEASRRIRAMERENNLPPVIIVCLTGNAREEHRRRALKSGGMDAYITKPINKVELFKTITNLLNESDANREARWRRTLMDESASGTSTPTTPGSSSDKLSDMGESEAQQSQR